MLTLPSVLESQDLTARPTSMPLSCRPTSGQPQRHRQHLRQPFRQMQARQTLLRLQQADHQVRRKQRVYGLARLFKRHVCRLHFGLSSSFLVL